MCQTELLSQQVDSKLIGRIIYVLLGKEKIPNERHHHHHFFLRRKKNILQLLKSFQTNGDHERKKKQIQGQLTFDQNK